MTVAGIIVFLLFRKMREREKLKRSGIETIDKMDGLQFEEYLAVLFKNHGYKTEVTKSSGDYGADLILKKDNTKTVVQAKRYKKNVGIKAVQEIHASKNYYKADEAWVVTNSDFTNPAKDLAKSNQVKLVNREALIDLIIAINSESSTSMAPQEVAMAETAKKEQQKQAMRSSVVIDAKCVVCDKYVSDKVKNHCLTNKKFNGEIYCFDHQKTVGSPRKQTV
nr:restriction endonuclease [Thalassobacillus devorans]